MKGTQRTRPYTRRTAHIRAAQTYMSQGGENLGTGRGGGVGLALRACGSRSTDCGVAAVLSRPWTTLLPSAQSCSTNTR